MQERTPLYNLYHNHRSREWWQGYIWWRNGPWLAECTACSKKERSQRKGVEDKGGLLFTASHHPYFDPTSRMPTAYSAWN